jgi:hypothetical protein
VSWNPFPKFDAGLFTRDGDTLTVDASDLGLAPGQRPHGAADGINLSGTPKGGDPLHRAAFWLRKESELGWLYVSATCERKVMIHND